MKDTNAFPDRTSQVLLSKINADSYREVVVRSYHVPREGTFHDILDVDHGDVRSVAESSVSRWISSGATYVIE